MTVNNIVEKLDELKTRILSKFKGEKSNTFSPDDFKEGTEFLGRVIVNGEKPANQYVTIRSKDGASVNANSYKNGRKPYNQLDDIYNNSTVIPIQLDFLVDSEGRAKTSTLLTYSLDAGLTTAVCLIIEVKEPNADNIAIFNCLSKCGLIEIRFGGSPNILYGLKGKTFLETGYMYAPYVPLVMTPINLKDIDEDE